MDTRFEINTKVGSIKGNDTALFINGKELFMIKLQYKDIKAAFDWILEKFCHADSDSMDGNIRQFRRI